MSEEIWKPVAGFESSHLVSNTGEVKTLDRAVLYRDGGVRKYKGGLLKQCILKNAGYKYVDLRFEGRRVKSTVHRLVAQAFIPNPENKRTVNHKDGNKLNNHVDNLEWNTYKENIHHAISISLFPGKRIRQQRGSEMPTAKLAETDIPLIRSLLNARYMVLTVSQMYGVVPKTIRSLRDGVTWSQIPL